MMNAGQKDVVVLPTNAGMNSIIKNAPYKIAATITFGNFYVASLHNDGNNVMDENDTILLFQKGNVPDKLFHYVYGDTFNAKIHYVSAVNDVAVAVRDKKFVEEDREFVPNYVLTAEPSYTNLYSQYNSYFSEYANLQEEYKTKSNNKEIFQASVFIKNTVETNLANAFLNKLESDINAAISDSSKLSEGMNKVEAPATFFGIAPQMAVNVLNNNNRMGLGFKKAKANKAAIDQFLTLFNITETNEENYF